MTYSAFVAGRGQELAMKAAAICTIEADILMAFDAQGWLGHGVIRRVAHSAVSLNICMACDDAPRHDQFFEILGLCVLAGD